MKYAIISDIHSNLEALQVVLEHIKKNRIDKVICCGDVVGYGPNPNECLGLLLKTPNISVVVGNHDEAVCGGERTNIEKFNDYAKKAVQINKGIISPENSNYLKTLPLTYAEDNLLFLHGSPRNPVNEYLVNFLSLHDNIKLFSEKICFVGHSHNPLIYSQTTEGEEQTNTIEGEKEIVLEDNRRYFINVGSVGQPRDEDNRSCFVYYDSNLMKISFIRLKYDIEKVQKKMKNLNIPEFLINRLLYGK